MRQCIYSKYIFYFFFRKIVHREWVPVSQRPCLFLFLQETSAQIFCSTMEASQKHIIPEAQGCLFRSCFFHWFLSRLLVLVVHWIDFCLEINKSLMILQRGKLEVHFCDFLLYIFDVHVFVGYFKLHLLGYQFGEHANFHCQFPFFYLWKIHWYWKLGAFKTEPI